MRRVGDLVSVAAVLLLAGCGSSDSGTDAATGPVDDTAVDDGPVATGEDDPGPGSSSESPFDLSVLGPAWHGDAEPFQPPPPRPSDCPELDRLQADSRAWTLTQRDHRVDGVLVAVLSGRAPTASDASAFLDRHAAFSVECPTIRFDDGGVTQVQPALSRVNQAGYPLRHDDLEGQELLLTVRDEWFIQVTIFADPAPAELSVQLNQTLLEQSLR